MFLRSRRIAIPGLSTADAAENSVPGTTAALERYFTEHYDALYRFLRSCGAADSLAEDISQESFLKLHRHLLEQRSTANVRAWLFRVGYNLWIDRLREGQREALAQDGCWELWRQILSDPAPGAEQELLARERRHWLRDAMGRLSQLERQALYLRADGLTYREVAKVLGIGYWPAVEAVRRALDILGDKAHGL